MRARARGASGLFILVILILAALGVLAAVALNRTTDSAGERQTTTVSLSKALAALDAFSSASARLPCPANALLDDGLEVIAPGGATCSFPQGTLPWNTLGMRRDDAYDAWGHKVSYRVYTGVAGSLTQPGGASMVDCDTVEAFPGGTTAVAGSSGGLCRADHTTTPAQFLAGKGLTVTDFGTVHSDVAYVVMSHGMTGLGSWTSSGAQLDAPKGDELGNTQAAGPFSSEAFSDPNTSVTSNTHFDDLLAYRTIPDLVKNANLSARDWPDDVLSAVTFDRNTLTTALGSSPHSDTGTSTIAFANVTVSAFNSGGTSEDISYVHGGGANDGIGGVNGGTNLLTSGGEGLRFDFASNAQQLAFTLDNFNTTGTSAEQVELRFFQVVGNVATLQGSPVTRQSCATDTQSESFSVNPSVAFNRVEIRPLAATGGGTSDFSLSEIRSCTASATCQASLAPGGHTCP